MRLSRSLLRSVPLAQAALALLACLAWGGANALGLGEIRVASRIGDKLHADIALTLESEELVEAGCVRLKKPASDDGLPWLQNGSYSVRRGASPVLALRSDAPVVDPVLKISVYIGCGFDVQRDYVVFLSPASLEVETPAARVIAPSVQTPLPRAPVRQAYAPLPAAPASSAQEPVKRESQPLRTGKRQKSGDRLVLMGAPGGRELSLAISTELSPGFAAASTAEQEKMREQLRLEYRMLQALHQQAINLLETVEKLRQMEQTLNELQARVEGGAKGLAPESTPLTPVPEAAPPAVIPDPALAPPPPAKMPEATPRLTSPDYPAVSSSGDTLFYAGLAAIVLLVAGGVLWHRRQQAAAIEERHSVLPPVLVVDGARDAELDLDEGAALAAAHTELDIDLTQAPPDAHPGAGNSHAASHFSVGNATLDEHFEVNPVMELADIMLSFGRVKGAAQALQEFIDNNPDEALKPWIRLMDVYRMAGMREEFERVAANLNQYFNVEIQHWGDAEAAEAEGAPAGSREEPLPIEWPSSMKKAKSVEEMPHICQHLQELWYGKSCIEYVEVLLRDNRGGLRTGFTIEVADELLFLLELQETLVKMDAETSAEEKS